MLLRCCFNRVRNKRYNVLFFNLFGLAACLSSCVLTNVGVPPSTHLVIQQAPNAHLSYVALGASDAWGTGAQDPDEQNWPHDLAGQLGAGTHLVNLGFQASLCMMR